MRWNCLGVFASLCLCGCAPQAMMPSVNDSDAATEQGQEATPAQTWSPTSTDALEVAKQLDQSLYELRNAEARFSIVSEDSELSGQSTGTIKIGGSGQYRLEYFRTNALNQLLLVVGNGRERRLLRNDGWGPITRVPTRWSKEASPILGQWNALFPRLAFRALTEAQPGYEPLVRELRQQGFEVKYEVSEFKINESYRPVGRIFATAPDRARHDIEIRLDGIRMVPLTIRMERKEPRREIIWTASWNFEQMFEPSVFSFPGK